MVVHADITPNQNSLVVNPTANIYAVSGNLAVSAGTVKGLSALDNTAANNAANALGEVLGEVELAYVYTPESGKAHLVWKLEVSWDNGDGDFGRDIIFYDARSNELVTRHPQVHPARHWGHYQLSEDLLYRALAIQDDNRFSRSDITRANILNDLSIFVSDKGQYQEALGFEEQALSLRLELFGENHLDVANSYRNIGYIYGLMAVHQKALLFKQKALSIQLEQLGENHPDVTKSFNNIGLTFNDLGQYEKALEFHQKAFNIRLAQYGEQHPDVAESFYNIGVIYDNLNQPTKALEFKQKALLILLQVFGEKHPDVAISYQGIGRTYAHLGRHHDALASQQKAQQIYLWTLGAEHPRTINSLWGTINSLIALNNFTAANNEVYQFEKLLPANHQQKQQLGEIQQFIKRQATKVGFHPKRTKIAGQKKISHKNTTKKTTQKRQITKSQKQPLKIQKLTIENFRAFKTFECDFEPDMTVLAGLNGQGKTAVLDAIAVAFGPFASGFATGKDRGITDPDIHLAKHQQHGNADTPDALADSYTMEHQLPVTIAAHAFASSSGDMPDNWARHRNSLKGRVTLVNALKASAEHLQKSVQNNLKVDLPLLSYYGTGRLWSQKRLTEHNAPQNQQDSRLDGYKNCLDPESSYADFSHWLRKETIAEFEYKITISENGGTPQTTARSMWLQAITQAIDTVLSPSGWHNIRYSAGQKQVVATHKVQGDVSVSSLSDGVRNTIGMVADIAYRAVRLNPHLLANAVTDTTGLVLIDEVDMHLHPQWQQLILQHLNKAFPGLQFIVTTHSPQVLSTVKQQNIRLLSNDNGVGYAKLPLGKTLAEASSDVLERVMDTDSRPPMPQVDKFREYMRWVESGKYNEADALQLRNELETLLGEEHSDLQKADRSIRRQEFLAQ